MRLVRMKKQREAGALLDQLQIQLQLHNPDASSFRRYTEALQAAANGTEEEEKLDHRLEEAKLCRQWSKAAALTGNTAVAADWRKRAEYLEFCYQQNLEV